MLGFGTISHYRSRCIYTIQLRHRGRVSLILHIMGSNFVKDGTTSHTLRNYRHNLSASSVCQCLQEGNILPYQNVSNTVQISVYGGNICFGFDS